ncbi:hypothetical protein GCM10009768_03780 [Leucobacter iarius]|uniref:Uncharacterized protein n=1 Tax=Leucobacter iarius TaxID=333963 RepID=A0ABP4XFQ2_9MICO
MFDREVGAPVGLVLGEEIVADASCSVPVEFRLSGPWAVEAVRGRGAGTTGREKRAGRREARTGADGPGDLTGVGTGRFGSLGVGGPDGAGWVILAKRTVVIE